ncbi:hypothetical protein IV60_GL001524 [Lancefieldella rimae]|uniref:Uncharacterized protein n=1 Tax=Lancefieldella rimae TaxID=1383 RepID=A0ABR5PY91_9ACTN|nr:hypothetical protein IV60_GL001524 [Lancefieldella rimae]
MGLPVIRAVSIALSRESDVIKLPDESIVVYVSAYALWMFPARQNAERTRMQTAHRRIVDKNFARFIYPPCKAE